MPAEELAELNSHIVGRIVVTEAFAGPDYRATIDPVTRLPSDLTA